MTKKLLALLALAGIMTMATASAQTLEIDGYSPEDEPQTPQLRIENIVGEIENLPIENAYYGYKTYAAQAPARITLLAEDMFTFEVVNVLGTNASIYEGALPVRHDGFGPEYDYVPYEEQLEGVEYKYDEMVMAEFSPINAGRTVTLTAPGIYYVEARYGAMNGASNAVIVINEGTAKYTSSKVMIDGEEVAFEAYNIADNNYFKLRDVAMALKDTSKAFNVGWDAEANAIELSSGAYTPAGGELELGDGTDKICYRSTQRVIDGEATWLKPAYNINGNNYFKLRDLGAKFGFTVDWDAENNCIMIDTTK